MVSMVYLVYLSFFPGFLFPTSAISASISLLPRLSTDHKSCFLGRNANTRWWWFVCLLPFSTSFHSWKILLYQLASGLLIDLYRFPSLYVVFCLYVSKFSCVLFSILFQCEFVFSVHSEICTFECMRLGRLCAGNCVACFNMSFLGTASPFVSPGQVESTFDNKQI